MGSKVTKLMQSDNALPNWGINQANQSIDKCSLASSQVENRKTNHLKGAYVYARSSCTPPFFFFMLLVPFLLQSAAVHRSILLFFRLIYTLLSIVQSTVYVFEILRKIRNTFCFVALGF